MMIFMFLLLPGFLIIFGLFGWILSELLKGKE